ncbi:hypothetical protein R6Q59_016207 [Mikania micrantha]
MTQQVPVLTVKRVMKKVVVAQNDQELLKKGTIVSIPTQKYQLVVVQQLNIQQGEIRLRKREKAFTAGISIMRSRGRVFMLPNRTEQCCWEDSGELFAFLETIAVVAVGGN